VYDFIAFFVALNLCSETSMVEAHAGLVCGIWPQLLSLPAILNLPGGVSLGHLLSITASNGLDLILKINKHLDVEFWDSLQNSRRTRAVLLGSFRETCAYLSFHNHT